MARHIIQFICVLGAAAGVVHSLNVDQIAQAQTPYYGGPRGARQPQKFGSLNRTTSRPTVSPYVNLLRRGNSTALNYYGLVRPEQDFRAANEQFSANFGQLESDLRKTQTTPDDSSTRTGSGHRTSFQSDLRGAPGSTVQTLKERDGLARDLPEASSSRLAPTGHGAYFGNTSTYFPSQQR